MNDVQLFYFLIFLTTVLLVLVFHSSFVEPRQSKTKVNRRIALMQSGGKGADTLQLLRRERWLLLAGSKGRLNHFTELAVQSGIPLEARVLALRVILGFLVCFVLAALKFGVSLTSLLVSVPTTLLAIYGIFRRARTKRIAKFREQLPEVLELLVRSLRAGHPLPVSFALAAREMPDPAGSEFGIVSDEIQFGSTVTAAIVNMAMRVGDPDLDYVVTCIAIQSQTGGNLGEVLSRLAKLIRDRFRLHRKVRALTSEARFSAIALSSFPIGLFLLVTLLAPNYYGESWGTPVFNKALLAGGALLGFGNLVMRRLANIKY
jgi:tight adherence protein B